MLAKERKKYCIICYYMHSFLTMFLHIYQILENIVFVHLGSVRPSARDSADYLFRLDKVVLSCSNDKFLIISVVQSIY